MLRRTKQYDVVVVGSGSGGSIVDAALQQGRLARALKCGVTEDQVQELRSMAAAILDQRAVDDSDVPSQ